MKLSKYVNDQKRIASLSADANAQEAAELMSELQCGNVIVEKDKRPIGIVTDRDIILRCVAQGKKPSSTSVKDIMTQDPVTLSGDETGGTALAKMKERGISRVIVVDPNDHAVGVITADHILRYIAEEIGMLASLSESMHDREREKKKAA